LGEGPTHIAHGGEGEGMEKGYALRKKENGRLVVGDLFIGKKWGRDRYPWVRKQEGEQNGRFKN